MSPLSNNHHLKLTLKHVLCKSTDFPRERVEYFSVTNDLVYVENPKVASTSIKKAMLGDLWNPSFGEVHKFSWKKKYSSYSVPQGKPYCFTFVRNPIERVISLYFDKIVLAQKGQRAFIYHPKLFESFSMDMSFEDMVNKIVVMPDNLAEKHYKRQIHLIKYVNNLSAFKVENLDDEFSKIAKSFNISMPKHEHKGQNRSNVFSMTANAFESLITYYKDDIDEFGYRNDIERLYKKYVSI